MTTKELAALREGDIIRHKHSPDAMIVTANYGDHAVAVRTAYVSNPSEWLLIDGMTVDADKVTVQGR